MASSIGTPVPSRAAGPASPAAPARGYSAAVLALLLAAYTFNFIDRTIVATIGQAIKVDLKITDAQLGLLGGLYFALLYTFLGIPVARLAERWSRTWIITASLVVWSGFTALCGAAHSFGQLALLRFGVGVGEAGCSPASHSLISDLYPARRRASALAVYSFGIPLGTMLGAMLGGWLAQDVSWRAAFVVVGLPGVLLALLVRWVVREPRRGGADAGALPSDTPPPTAAAAGGLAHELRELGVVARALLGRWPVLNMVIGVTIASFAAYGAGQFTPPYFVRRFGLGLKEVGLIVGLIAGVSNGLGTLLGGFLTDALGRRSPRWRPLVPAIGLLVATPLYVAAFLQPDWRTAALILLFPGLFHYTYLAPTFAAVQNAVEARRRATATALLFFILNLVALGGGPPFTGWLIDRLAGFDLAHPGGAESVWRALIGAFGGGAHGPAFAQACPGGLAPRGAAAGAAAACHAAGAAATGQGVVVTVCLYAWASLHYFLAAIGMRRATDATGATRPA